jgi:hypothetical protein
LEQVEADERGEPEPVWAVVVREQKAQEDERSGESTDDEVHFHKMAAFNFQWKLVASSTPTTAP